MIIETFSCSSRGMRLQNWSENKRYALGSCPLLMSIVDVDLNEESCKPMSPYRSSPPRSIIEEPPIHKHFRLSHTCWARYMSQLDFNRCHCGWIANEQGRTT